MGKRLFRDGAPSRSLKLLDSRSSSTGVIFGRYEPDGPARYGSFAEESS
jgi:hypothetical protein